MPGVLNLGLECLKDSETTPTNVLSYEFLDAVFEYNEACEELTVVFNEFDALVRAAENLQAVADVIKEQGVTPALEALVGENFINGVSEASVEEASISVWAKIGDFFIRIWQAIKSFFTKFFNSSKGLSKRLKAWIKEASKAGARNVGRGFTGLDEQTRDRIKSAFDSVGVYDKANQVAIVNQGNKGSTTFPTLELNFDGKVTEAKTYANALLVMVDTLVKNEPKYLKHCDDQISKAHKAMSAVKKNYNKASETDVKPDKDRAQESVNDQKDLIHEAESARTTIVAAVKSITQAVGQFLANNTIRIDSRSAAEKDLD